MKTLGLALTIMAALLSASARAAPLIDVDKVQQAMFATLLLDDDSGKSRLGVRAIRKFYPKDQALTDLIAERLVQSTVTEVKTSSMNTVAWYIAMLGEIGTARYRDTLLQVKQHTVNKALLTNLESALKKIGNASGAAYVVGTSNLAANKEEYAKILAANRGTDRSAFGSIKEGSTLVEVLQALGAPDYMTAWKVRTQKLEVHYAGAGLVVLSIENEIPPRWLAYVVARELFPVRESYTGEQFGVAQNLGSLENKLLVQYLKFDSRHVKTDLGVQAIIARRIRELPFPDNRYEAKALERVLKMLAISKDPKAIGILREVAAASANNDGVKVAQKMLLVYEKRQRAARAKGANSDDPKEDKDLMDDETDDAEEEEAPPR